MSFADEVPAELPAAFMLRYNVTARGAVPTEAAVPARIRCRVRESNIVVLEAFDDNTLTGATTELVRSTSSLLAPPTACEIVFAYRKGPFDEEHPHELSNEIVAATAC